MSTQTPEGTTATTDATTTVTSVVQGGALTFEERRHARNLGIAYVVLAGITAIFLTRHEGTATFNLDGGRSFGLPAQGLGWFVAASLAVVAGIQLWRGFGKYTNVILAMASVLVFMSFLAWAAAGRGFSFIGMLASAVTFSTPLIFGACAGIMCERSGVVNIAIEGLLLNGAFTSALVGSIAAGWPGLGDKSGFWIGVLAAMITSALLAWLLAWLAIRFKVDQVIVGFFINFFVLGLTSFLSSRVLTTNPDYNDTPTLGAWKIPLLERIPVLGQILFQQTVFVYGAYLLVVVFTWFLFRSKWGLRTRAVGEHPRAADTLGINVLRLRYRNVIIAGGIAGFGGAWWTATLGRFNENITNGRGFIALAVVIVGRWHPVGALCAALLFGLFDSVADKLSLLNTGLPSEFIKMTPYLMTIVVVAGFVGRSRGPKAAGQPYESQ
ncbi:MAG: ABC transporter permease [Acidimicrobiales bacterium]